MKRDMDIVRKIILATANMPYGKTLENLDGVAKETVIKPGISFTLDTLKEWLKAEIASGLPTLRGLAG